jgi:hypothetical protein
MNNLQKIFGHSFPVILTVLLVSGCTQTTETRDTPQNQQNKPVLIEQYEQEGFLSKDLYRVIIVKPFGSNITNDELEKQVKSKAIASLKKYITSNRKSLTANTNADILNLINNSGTIREYSDSTRNFFILDITKPGCRSFVDSLGQ